jgi:peptidoglycan pentaglycine glycine transferase (the first glycine)
MPELTPAQWEEFTTQHPEIHLLQSRPWGDLKEAFGWRAARVGKDDAGVQILLRRIVPGISMAYIPKGPAGMQWEVLSAEVDALCKRRGIAFLKIEPDAWESEEQPIQPPAGFFASPHSIQPPRTSIVNLSGDEKSILAGMKQKTRYNINLALKKGVVVHTTSDIKLFHSLMEITGERDEFGVHNLAYYQTAYDLFHPRGSCELFLAQYEDEPLAALMAFAQGPRSWYLYGGSSNLHRDRMPNYLLQWEAMRWARGMGCVEYDLWGIPDVDEHTLEQNFLNREDGLWGVYRFKRGFGGEVRRSAGPWDKVYRPMLYKIYRFWLRARKLEA